MNSPRSRQHFVDSKHYNHADCNMSLYSPTFPDCLVYANNASTWWSIPVLNASGGLSLTAAQPS